MDIYQAILLLQTEDECRRFLSDLCTPVEVEEMQNRWEVCQLLEKGGLTYREIKGQTGVSLATISRVARFLKNEPHYGYRTVLERMG
jgi:TrpR-related protein YerC/YecD